MSKFNLLIIGDVNHQYIHNFSKWIKTIKSDISITIVSFHALNLDKPSGDFFDKIIIVPENNKFVSKIKGLRILNLAYKLKLALKKNKIKPNTILVHFVRPQLAFIGRFLKKITRNYVLAIWGSDFYRSKQKILLDINLKNADNIIIGSPQGIVDFTNKFQKYSIKTHLCYFGSEPIEELLELKKTKIDKKQSCRILKLPKDKLNVCIGHSGSKYHNHLTILKQLKEIDEITKDKIRIILPMTYGLEEGYLNEVINECNETQIEYRIFKDFLSDFEVANMRNLTDIMINMLTTDAFSGSMREILFSGGIVINGSWLPYNFLKDMNVYFEEVDSISEIANKLVDIVANYYNYRERCSSNPSIIYNISSWSQTIQRWLDVIELKNEPTQNSHIRN